MEIEKLELHALQPHFADGHCKHLRPYFLRLSRFVAAWSIRILVVWQLVRSSILKKGSCRTWTHGSPARHALALLLTNMIAVAIGASDMIACCNYNT